MVKMLRGPSEKTEVQVYNENQLSKVKTQLKENLIEKIKAPEFSEDSREDLEEPF